MIEKIVENLPEVPGVYIFKDGEGNIVYIGKAKNLRERVKSYFRNEIKGIKTESLVKSIKDLDFVVLRTEKEAFLLENNLIKTYKPKYNINLKDDKTYISIKLTLKERFPALFITRKIKDDGSIYFGPYPHAKETKEILRLVQTIYPIRRCKETQFKRRKRACILSALGRCLAPCEGRVEERVYREMVDELVDFLSGKNSKVLKDLEEKIKKASSLWDFDEAERLKKRYLAIKDMLERQKVHEHLGKDRDVWAFVEEEDKLNAVVLSFRKGVLLQKRTFKEKLHEPFKDAISSLLFQFYDTKPVPQEIILSEEIEEMEFLREYLTQKKGSEVSLYGSEDLRSKEFIALAIENLYEKDVSLEDAFKNLLHLSRYPKRIEVYDVSHTFGKNAAGVMVVFEHFKKKKEGYRIFHIKEASTQDDVAMIGEVLRRRFLDENIGPFPDLIVIDGGKGQVSSACKVLKELKKDLDIIGIAKGRKRKIFEEAIVLPLRKNPLFLPKSSNVFKALIEMRDEAHRFAISSHKKWKRKEDLGEKKEIGEGLKKRASGIQGKG